LGHILPRHLEIIFEINHRFLDEFKRRFPEKGDLVPRLSIIEEGREKRIRMSHLAIIGSHTVNGVAELHSKILKESLFREFHEFFPGKFINITNGITPRRWLLESNPKLADLIFKTIGEGWMRDLYQLKKLEDFADKESFQQSWAEIKRNNKKKLADYILTRVGITVNPDSIFDIQVKRIHEYKRQLLNIFHVITLYHRLKNNPKMNLTPRTVIFGGKAAPGYYMAKLTIKLITSVAEKINNDRGIRGLLKVVFLPNYCVSVAQKIIPAADLSEQISTAGMEASGTGNMKFSLNGALTIGTLDGANVEIMEEVGRENIFIFGLKADEINALRSRGYNPYAFYEKDAELRQVLEAIDRGDFSPMERGLFKPIVQSMLENGDHYFLLADYRAYLETQEKVAALFENQKEWTKKSILNTARMGKFSSDRAVLEYAEKIWQVKPILPKSQFF
jgi:starch phosphorylase